jgi:hypothetical protein
MYWNAFTEYASVEIAIFDSLGLSHVRMDVVEIEAIGR